MSDTPKSDALKSLVSQALGKPVSQAPSVAEQDSTTAPSDETLQDSDALMAIYFEVTEPEERDVIFDELCATPGKEVDDFFAEMAAHDTDAYVRAAAQAELLKRGHKEFLPNLEADLVDPQEIFFFSTAIHTLAGIRGEPFYPALVQMLADTYRDPEHVEDIMLAMETVAPAQAAKHFAALISGWKTPNDVDDLFLEWASLCFARQAFVPGHHALLALATTIEQSDLEPQELNELKELIASAIDVSTPNS